MPRNSKLAHPSAIVFRPFGIAGTGASWQRAERRAGTDAERLGPAHGILLGLVIGTALWALIGLGLWHMLRPL